MILNYYYYIIIIYRYINNNKIKNLPNELFKLSELEEL